MLELTTNLLIKAQGVMVRLQNWIEEHEDWCVVPCANLSCSTYTLDVKINDVMVWSSEDSDDDELTFEFCRDAFLTDLSYMKPFEEDLKKFMAGTPEAGE